MHVNDHGKQCLSLFVLLTLVRPCVDHFASLCWCAYKELCLCTLGWSPVILVSYTNARLRYTIRFLASETGSCNVTLSQGAILSLIIFALYMDPLIARLSLDLGCKRFDKYYDCFYTY